MEQFYYNSFSYYVAKNGRRKKVNTLSMLINCFSSQTPFAYHPAIFHLSTSQSFCATFSLLTFPTSHPSSSLSADDFATYSTGKVKAIRREAPQIPAARQSTPQHLSHTLCFPFCLDLGSNNSLFFPTIPEFPSMYHSH
jgi:hypothetical protein